MSLGSTHGTDMAFIAWNAGTASSRVGCSANSRYVASFWIIAVSTPVGQTALTVIPLRPTSRASDLTSPITPHFAAQ
jgi:hypothetical protein